MTMKNKKKYLICVKQTDFQYVEVDAESLAEARMIAHHLDYDKAFNDDPTEVGKYDIPKEYDHEVSNVCEYAEVGDWIDSMPVFHADSIPYYAEDPNEYSESEYRDILAIYEKEVA